MTVNFSGGGGGAFKLLGSVTANNDATISVTGLASNFKSGNLMLGLSELKPVTDNVIPRLKISNTSTTYGSLYYTARSGMYADGTVAENYSEDASSAYMNMIYSSGVYVGNSVREGFGALLSVNQKLKNGMHFAVVGHYAYLDTGSEMQSGYFSGKRFLGADLDGFQFSFSAGNIASGTMSVWGLNNG